jgi:hypothetical protein
MSERSVLRFKSASRSEWRNQDGQDEPEHSSHGAQARRFSGDQHGSYFRYTHASNKLIARRLGISAHTAKFHVAQIIAKLQAQSRAHAVAKALRAGFVDV